MGMFDNYSNLNPNYIPNNIVSRNCIYTTIDDEMPKDTKNILGIFSGYKWMYGEKFDFNLSCNFKIKVNPTALIYKQSGEAPTTSTLGFIGQNAYNTVDVASWTCVGMQDSDYVWIKDDDLTYPINGAVELEMTPDMTGATLMVKLYNFRYELMKEYSSTESNTVSIHINDEFYSSFGKDSYPFELYMVKGNESRLIQKSCIIID